jgi:predicted Zn finger-like uncharacterized protein
MPPVKITCPECEAVLKVSQPPPPGKKLKCPRCGETFSAPGAPAGARTAAPAVKKKPAGKKPDDAIRAPAPPKKTHDEDDEEGGTYGVVKDPDEETAADEEEEEEEGRRKGPEINYAPDMSIKDLRGPAQAAVVGPSNLLIIYGIIGFLGWLLVMFIVLIPILFPVQTDDTSKEADKGGAAAGQDKQGQGDKAGDKKGKEKKEKEVPWTVVFGLDLAILAALPWYIFIPILLGFGLGMAYGGTIVVGGVKMQSLESRQWGLVASIMNMIPVHTFGLMVLLTVIVQMILGLLFDEPAKSMVMIGLLVAVAGLGVLVGLLNLRTLMREDVIAGFEYKPD